MPDDSAPAETNISTVADRLTRRQLDVLDLIGDGLANKSIAGQLGIGTCTVKTHVSHILRILDVTNRTEAAIFAQRERLPTVLSD